MDHKKMKTLFTNGCSWKWGGGLDSKYSDDTLRNQITWPAQLKSLMNFDTHVNLATGCGSNQRIVRTTLEWIWQQTPETLKNATAVIQWTEQSRYEYYYPKDTSNRFENYPDRWARVKIGVVISNPELLEKYNHDYTSLFQVSQRRYKTYTDIEGLYRYLTECEALASIFKSYNIKYYYWTYCGENFNIPDVYKQFLTRFNWLEPLKGVHNWNYDRIPNDNHPSELGHLQIAQYIKQGIDNENN